MTPGLHASAQTSVLTPHNPPPNITPPSTNTHKRPATSVPTPQPASKRARPGYSENTPPSPGPGIAPTLSPPPVLSVPGAGPITSPPASMKANNTAQIPASGRSSAAATDVWYFVVPVKSKEPADVLSARQANLHPLASRPESDYIACRLCSNKSIAVWKCAEGQTKTIRKHLQEKHGDVYSESVVLLKLKGWEDIARSHVGSTTPTEVKREPFTLEGFYTRLIKWIAIDDQSVNVIDSPELRELLLYLNADLKPEDLYHRTKVADLILKRFSAEYEQMALEIQNSLGRISFTSDIWSRQTLEPYMAVTAHYMASDADGNLVMKGALIAFHQLKGSHSGENIAKAFFEIVERLGVSSRIGMITLDNASNNNTFMVELAKLLERKGISFDHHGNRIRCFPHVINIAVKTGLKYITNVDPTTDVEVSAEEIAEGQTRRPPPTIDTDYIKALQSDVLAAVRKLAVGCRASHMRREVLRKVIIEGNEKGWFNGQKLPEVNLLRDVDTRWSSIYLMGRRVRELYPAVKIMLSQDEHKDIRHLLLTQNQLRVLDDLLTFLEIFHTAQQLVSADKTPTLSIVIPVYEQLVVMLQDARRGLPNLSHAIDASLAKLREYIGKAQGTPMYGLAMVINPSIKFKYTSGKPQEHNKLLVDVMNTMLVYQCANPIDQGASFGRRQIQLASAAARAQTSGLRRFNALAKSLSTGTLTPSLQAQPTQDPPSNTNTRDRDNDDRKIVEDELSRWIGGGLISAEDEVEDLDLVVFWRNNRKKYPLLYRIALDVLPVQASAVPCERVFSSSKETDALRRSNIEPAMMEALQLLKFRYRSERLNFSEGRLATEEECGTVIDIEPSVFENMLMSGDIDGLQTIIATSHQHANQ